MMRFLQAIVQLRDIHLATTQEYAQRQEVA